MAYNFKEIVPFEYVYNLFTEICCKENNKDVYIFNNGQFKKLKIKNELNTIVNELRPYYKNSRSGYLENAHIYKKFITVLRHLAKLHNIKYTNVVKYIHSSYDIEYYFEL